MKTFVRLAAPLLLLALLTVGAYRDSNAAGTFCNITSRTSTLFEGNTFTVKWQGSNNVYSAFVAWPVDSRGHWTIYDLNLTADSLGKTLSHTGSVTLDLSDGVWSKGMLFVYTAHHIEVNTAPQDMQQCVAPLGEIVVVAP